MNLIGRGNWKRYRAKFYLEGRKNMKIIKRSCKKIRLEPLIMEAELLQITRRLLDLKSHCLQ
jgi:hypothetical protein